MSLEANTSSLSAIKEIASKLVVIIRQARKAGRATDTQAARVEASTLIVSDCFSHEVFFMTLLSE